MSALPDSIARSSQSQEAAGQPQHSPDLTLAGSSAVSKPGWSSCWSGYVTLSSATPVLLSSKGWKRRTESPQATKGCVPVHSWDRPAKHGRSHTLAIDAEGPSTHFQVARLALQRA